MRYKPVKFIGSKLLFITAHPDDESYLCSGTMAKNYENGGENILICATDGERGTGHLAKPVPEAKLKKIRRTELAKACDHLRVKKLFCLELPDGKVVENKARFYAKSLAIARQASPEFVFGFGSDGITGHNDHVASWGVASKIAKVLNKPYFAFAFSPRVARSASTWLIPRRRARHYSQKLVLPRANVKVSIGKGVKLKALTCHKSQLDSGSAFVGYPKYAVADILAADYYVV